MNEKLLIVDDEKGVVDMLKSYFEMQSFVVYTAYDLIRGRPNGMDQVQ